MKNQIQRSQDVLIRGALAHNAERIRALRSPSPFIAALRVAILAKVRQMRAAGDTGMSLDCLRQCVNAPSHLLAGAPCGTNAVYIYSELFRAEALNVAGDFILSTREVRA